MDAIVGCWLLRLNKHKNSRQEYHEMFRLGIADGRVLGANARNQLADPEELENIVNSADGYVCFGLHFYTESETKFFHTQIVSII